MQLGMLMLSAAPDWQKHNLWARKDDAIQRYNCVAIVVIAGCTRSESAPD